MASAPASAALMNYGTVMSDNFTYVDVTEDNLEDDLYYDGNISTSGDTLLIDPEGFGVQVNPGPGAHLLDSELEMMILPKNDTTSIDKLFFDEEGDFSLVGGGSASASVAYFWQILEVDGNPIDPISGNGNRAFSSSTPGTGQLWSLDFSVDLAAELDAAAVSGDRITKVGFRFDNTLSALAGDGEVAFIKKKQTGGIRICAAGVNGTHADCVPEPSSLALLLVSLFGFVRRR